MASDSNPLLDHPRYEKLKTLGQGSFGVVLLCKDKQEDRHVAIKLLNRGIQVTRAKLGSTCLGFFYRCISRDTYDLLACGLRDYVLIWL